MDEDIQGILGTDEQVVSHRGLGEGDVAAVLEVGDVGDIGGGATAGDQDHDEGRE